ncbi:Oxysterol-binding protein-related protein 11 [Blattella germanica]|nr:Oxysterol-binding protein-related protein 11 [Blattella germanica]
MNYRIFKIVFNCRFERSSERLCQPFEGQLCKYTNVMKGWQFRWFVLDPESGVLDYYLNHTERNQRPRGSVQLAAAVISPSDEDSNTFTVNSAAGEVFKLRAADARERHDWISRIRAECQLVLGVSQDVQQSFFEDDIAQMGAVFGVVIGLGFFGLVLVHNQCFLVFWHFG